MRKHVRACNDKLLELLDLALALATPDPVVDQVAVVELEKALTSNKVGFARKNWARETLGSFLLEGREGVPADPFRSACDRIS